MIAAAGRRKRASGKKMIRSMTGFGKGTEKCPYGRIIAEIKTLNHKSLSVVCNPFNGFFLLDEKIKRILEKKIFRGKVFVRIAREGGDGQKSLHKIEISANVAREYLRKIKKVQKSLGVKGEIQIQALIGFPGVMESSVERKEEKIWPYIRRALEKALEKLLEYRKSEGLRLAEDFNTRLRRMEKNIQKIRKYGKQSVAGYRKKLVQSIRDIAKNAEMEKGRLETEVALFAKNCDIAEEITRLKGHLVVYKDVMCNVKADAGKKLDFIAQEMQREANTIGAKSSDFRISQTVIELKSDIEKIREQVKNVE
ncbi:MAG: YicC family protein [Candidatus Makaraimicrobium thalassicum]|nr:MAG: YicC family protein [Candidatus Omnitrophota bacterium]